MSVKFAIPVIILQLNIILVLRATAYVFYVAVKSKELADTKQRLSEVTEKHADRSRQLQRLQVSISHIKFFLLLKPFYASTRLIREEPRVLT